MKRSFSFEWWSRLSCCRVYGSSGGVSGIKAPGTFPPSLLAVSVLLKVVISSPLCSFCITLFDCFRQRSPSSHTSSLSAVFSQCVVTSLSGKSIYSSFPLPQDISGVCVDSFRRKHSQLCHQQNFKKFPLSTKRISSLLHVFSGIGIGPLTTSDRSGMTPSWLCLSDPYLKYPPQSAHAGWVNCVIVSVRAEQWDSCGDGAMLLYSIECSVKLHKARNESSL